MATRNPPPRPNFIASYADGCIVFIAYPRLNSGLRVPANQVFKLLKKRALDIRCFCDRPASVFRVNKPDSLLNGDFVAMCNRKGLNMTEAYDQASYLWPVDPQSFQCYGPVFNQAGSPRLHSFSTRSTRLGNNRVILIGFLSSITTRIESGMEYLRAAVLKNQYPNKTLDAYSYFMAVPVKRTDSKKLCQQDALYTFGQDSLNVIPYPRESTGSLKLPSQVWEALTDGSITLRCFHHKRVLVKPKAGNMNGPISVKCPLGFWQQCPYR
ncbi:hypothetical protein EV360DRAFT_67454, partial [Lentinula raphanica]